MRHPSATDRCPGVLRPHQAADGAVLRLRMPGGHLSGSALALLAEDLGTFADGNLYLTSRANVQLRGVRVDSSGSAPRALVATIETAGLLPSGTHERVRNIVASPLTGLLGGLFDVRPVVRELDRLLCAEEALSGLSGRFLFTVDDGRGDLSTVRADVSARVLDRRRALVCVGDRPGGLQVHVREVAATMARLANRFLDVRGDAWHVADLPRAGRELVEPTDLPDAGSSVVAGQPDFAMSYGILEQDDGRRALSVLVPLGTLDPRQIQVLVDAGLRGTGDLVVTPWRGFVVPNVAAGRANDLIARLNDTGLVSDSGSPWARITACVGSPGCANAWGDTRVLAHEVASQVEPEDGLPVHIVACDRRCGTPSGPHTLLVAGAQR